VLGLTRNDFLMLLFVLVLVAAAPILLNPFPENSSLAQFNAGYPDLMQRFLIFGIFAIGFNILFGLTGYLSFGHAAFLGAGSYAGVWMLKLLTINVIPAILMSTIVAGIFSLLIGYISLRRSGIYFSILTLAFAQMSFALASSVLQPITGGEAGVQTNLNDPRILDGANTTGNIPAPSLFGLEMRDSVQIPMGGLAGGLMVAMDPLAGSERMQWTASGEVVLMTILGGVGTVLGPVIGAGIIKYFENIFSKINDNLLHGWFSFMPDGLEDFMVAVIHPFVGKGWHLSLGLMFMLAIIFLPGGLIGGINDASRRLFKKREQ